MGLRPNQICVQSPEMNLLLSVVILNWNTRDLLAQCLEAVSRAQAEVPCEIIVVDKVSLGYLAKQLKRV